MASRSSAYNYNEDIFLCRIYMEVSQDPCVGVYQTSDRFWNRVETSFNRGRQEHWENRTQRSLQARIQSIEKAAKKFHACIRAIENRQQSGASNQDIMLQAKVLVMEDPKYKSGWKFDHVWPIIKDFEKFKDCRKSFERVSPSLRHISSESENLNSGGQVSPGISCSPLNLDGDCNTSGGSPSERPIGVKKAKFKRKKEDYSSCIVSTLREGNKQLLEELQKSSTQLQQQLDRSSAHREASHALREVKREDKILFQDMTSIKDLQVRAYFEAEKARILQKRAQQHQSQPAASHAFGTYLNLGECSSELPDY